MRTVMIAAATVIGLALAGCGQQAHGGGSHGASNHGAGHQGTPVASRCVHPPVSAKRTITLTDSDNGEVICVGLNTGIYVFLHSTPAKPWSRPAPSSGSLTVRPSGIFTLARGVTGAYFGASSPGTVTVTSAKPPCRAAGNGTGPHCSPSTFFKVTVLIHGTL